MNEKIEIGDGFVELKEDIWITGEKFGRFSIDKGYIAELYYDSNHRKMLATTFIKFQAGGSISLSGVDMNYLKEYCYRDINNAEIKQVEFIMNK